MKLKKKLVSLVCVTLLAASLSISVMADNPIEVQVTDGGATTESSEASTPSGAMKSSSSVSSLPHANIEENSSAQQSAVPKNIPTGAKPYPTDIQLYSQGPSSFLYKTYTLAADVDPKALIEADFSQGGYQYRYSETILREYQPANLSKPVAEIKSLDIDTKEREAILAILDKELAYSDNDGYVGTLSIMPKPCKLSKAKAKPISTRYQILVTWTIVNKLDRKKEIKAWKNTRNLLC